MTPSSKRNEPSELSELSNGQFYFKYFYDVRHSLTYSIWQRASPGSFTLFTHWQIIQRYSSSTAMNFVAGILVLRIAYHHGRHV